MDRRDFSGGIRRGESSGWDDDNHRDGGFRADTRRDITSRQQLHSRESSYAHGGERQRPPSLSRWEGEERSRTRGETRPRTRVLMPASVRDSSVRRNYFASCAPGLEEVVARELLGADVAAESAVPGHAGVAFTGTLETGYRANLWLRVCASPLCHPSQASPVRHLLKSFACRTARRTDVMLRTHLNLKRRPWM